MNIEMNTEMIVALTSAFISMIGMFSALFSYRQYRTCRGLLEFTGQQLSDLDNSASGMHETIEGYKRKTADQSRRIAWLESRIRQPKLLREDVIDDTPAGPVKWTMTERRHRVLTLAARGQSPDTIAATLGMMPGEVELIVKLNRVGHSSHSSRAQLVH